MKYQGYQMTKYGQNCSFESVSAFRYTRWQPLSMEKTYWGSGKHFWNIEVQWSNTTVTKWPNMSKNAVLLLKHSFYCTRLQFFQSKNFVGSKLSICENLRYKGQKSRSTHDQMWGKCSFVATIINTALPLVTHHKSETRLSVHWPSNESIILDCLWGGWPFTLHISGKKCVSWN